MLERILATIRQWVRLAWWDGSCIGLRLHPMADLLVFGPVRAEPVARPVAMEVSDDRR